METGNIRKKRKDIEIVRKRIIQKNNTVGMVNRYNINDFLICTAIVVLSSIALLKLILDGLAVWYPERTLTIFIVFTGVLFSVYYKLERLKPYRLIIFILSFTLTIVIGFFQRNSIKKSFVSIINDIINQLNNKYSGTIKLIKGGNNKQIIILLIISFYLVWLIAKSVICKRDSLLIIAIVIPFLIISVICGGRLKIVNCFILMICYILMISISKVRKRDRFWGKYESETDNYKDNVIADKKIRIKVTGLTFVLCILVALFTYQFSIKLINRPVNNLVSSFSGTKNKGLNALEKYVPKMTGGRLNFTTSGVGGGSSGGVLGELEGTFFSRNEYVTVSCTELPKQTVYLKGYIGSEYHNNRWDYHDEKDYKEIVKAWTDEENPEIYVQNIPFLRAGYATKNLSNSEIKNVEPEFINVESKDEKLGYTYIPYNAFVNDYYEINGGDGFIKYQDKYENSFMYYPMDDYTKIINEWNTENDKGTLDSVEALYGSYAKSTYLKDDSVNLGDFDKQCITKKEEWENSYNENMTLEQTRDLDENKYEDIINFVRNNLVSTCSFKAEAIKLPKGKDYIEYFLFEKKVGDSTAFASAATIMFRKCGIPARYVEGYVATKDSFIMNESGGYSATLMDDNAHAWVEIYIEGTGWIPVETTPGFDGINPNMDNPEEETTEVENETTITEEKVAPTKNVKIKRIIRLILYGLLTVFLISLVVIPRSILLKRQRRGLLYNKSSREKIKILFCSFYELLVYDGFSTEIGTTTEEFKEEVLKKYSEITEREMNNFMNIVLMVHYGRNDFDNENITFERECEFSNNMYEKLVSIVLAKMSLRRRILCQLIKAF